MIRSFHAGVESPIRSYMIHRREWGGAGGVFAGNWRSKAASWDVYATVVKELVYVLVW